MCDKIRYVVAQQLFCQQETDAARQRRAIRSEQGRLRSRPGGSVARLFPAVPVICDLLSDNPHAGRIHDPSLVSLQVAFVTKYALLYEFLCVCFSDDLVHVFAPLQGFRAPFDDLNISHAPDSVKPEARKFTETLEKISGRYARTFEIKKGALSQSSCRKTEARAAGVLVLQWEGR